MHFSQILTAALALGFTAVAAAPAADYGHSSTPVYHAPTYNPPRPIYHPVDYYKGKGYLWDGKKACWYLPKRRQYYNHHTGVFSAPKHGDYYYGYQYHEYPAHQTYKKPVHKPTYKKPTYKPTYKKPTYKPTYKKPTYKPVYKKPTYKPVYKKPAVDPVYKKPVVDPVYKKPVVDPVYKKPVPDPVYKKPVADPVYKKPTPQPTYKAPSNEYHDDSYYTSQGYLKDSSKGWWFCPTRIVYYNPANGEYSKPNVGDYYYNYHVDSYWVAKGYVWDSAKGCWWWATKQQYYTPRTNTWTHAKVGDKYYVAPTANTY